MKRIWAQPSLSRDFALLAAAILFAFSVVSTLVTYSTYGKHTEHVTREMEKESLRIEQALNAEMETANYTLNSIGKYIALEPDWDLTRLAKLLKSFDSKDYLYSIVSWVNPQHQLVVSSNLGVLEKPVDVSDREHIKKAVEPWKMVISPPIEGRVSGRRVIPVAMALTDSTGKFIGILSISINLNMLTEHISSQFKRDGLNFAILNKSLTPIFQVADDKDFITDNFSLETLADTNLSAKPSALVSKANMFWNSGNYSYYHASPSSPYVVLLSYDSRSGDEAVRGLLWWRLLQVLAMAIFFMAFLWIVRIRMIKPVLEMTNVVAAVAKGESCPFVPQSGPVEIEGLATQVRKISEYIKETKRIHDELRNKMFMMKKAKDTADIERRSQSEFLAYICQEMRTPLNNIIGGAQVMKDQLYGPLENRKYRQYASDIYTTGNILIDSTQDLLTLAKAEMDYIELVEKPVEIAGAINKTLRFLSDKMQAEKLGIKVQLQEPMPRLMADEFRLQQILMNLLLHALSHALPESTIMLEAKLVTEGRDKMYFAFVINSSGKSLYTNAELFALAEKAAPAHEYRPAAKVMELLKEQTDISLELAKTLINLHQGSIDIAKSTSNTVAIAVFFSGNRVRFVETPDT